MSVMEAPILAPRMVFMFSTRESPSPMTPALSHALAISGVPKVALVTPVTEIPFSRRRVTSVSALCEIFSRLISRRGAS